MRIGIMAGAGDGSTLEQLVAQAERAEAAGFATFWLANIFSYDAITALAVVGGATRRIELGTAVVPTYPRHPLAIAQQALTTNAASGGRFTLGIGLSHKLVIEDMFGLSYAHPARHMREYLEVLTPLLRGEAVDYKGEEYKARAALSVPGGAPTRLLVAALGPAMLRLTGRFADGTITWMTGVKTLASHTVPTLRKAAEEAGRPAPRIVAGLPIALVRDAAAARETASKQFSIYGQLPSYRAMLDREGAATPGEVAIVGDEKALRAGIARLRDAGVTDFDAAVAPLEPGAAQRTLEFLAAEL
ncbi:MAG TPA: LLM class F420-dependent oxidoreductase [Myxococcota bacterium]|nr:LLM class F420-dependent oxidoreductase [Myxococcota bacterium]